MDLNKKNIRSIMVIITFTIVLCVLLFNIGAILGVINFIWGICFPFVLGGAIAFVVNIPMSFFERLLKKIGTGKFEKIMGKAARPLAFFITLLVIVLTMAIVLQVVVPQLSSTIESVGAAMTTSLPRFQQWLEETFAEYDEIAEIVNSLELDWGKWLEGIKDFALSGASNVLTYTMSATKLVLNGVVTFFIAFIFSIYLLMQKENLARQITKVLCALFNRKAVDRIQYIANLSHVTFSRFITGQCLEALILGMMFFIAMSIFRFPYALLVGIVIAFSALIPVVGAFAGCFIGAFLILMVNPMQALLFIILFLVLQQLEGNLIYPYVVGNSVGLPAIWVLVAVTLGGKLMGVAGMLICIPLVSVVYSLFRDWINRRLAGKKV
jgi:predicted PurR-regulated permease PerM